MEPRAPFSGGSSQPGGPPDPTAIENLLEVERLLADKKPWPSFLLGERANDCPEIVGEALEWLASGAVGLLNVASVEPLTPVCEAFKGLIEAAKGAAQADENLRELIAWCVFLTRVLLQHGKDVDGLLPVMTPLRAFVSTASELETRAKTLAARRKCAAFFCFWKDGKQIQDFDTELRGIWQDIQGLTVLAIHADFRHALPPRLGEMAKVPDEAVELPPAFVARHGIVEAVVEDLLAADRAANGVHVLRVIPGGGKTVAASSVVRNEDLRRSFKDGIFWVHVGLSGKGKPTALLKGLAEDLAHAPSNRPHTVPHEFRDVEHVISHLVSVREQGRLRCLVVLDDVWDREIVPLFLRTGFDCLVTTRDLAVVPRGLRVSCTEVEMMTEIEALKLLTKASLATSCIPRDEGLKIAEDCGFLPLAMAIIGALDSSRANPHSPETWRGVHKRLTEEPTLVQDHVTGALGVSFRELNEKARARFRMLGVLAPGVRAPVDMVAYLWEQDPVDTAIFLKELVDKSLVKVVEQSYLLHDLVLDFARDELRKLRGKVHLIATLQAQYLSRISVLNDYASAGEVLSGFYALMALWQSVEDLSGNKELEASMYMVNLRGLKEESGPTSDLAYTNLGRLFQLQGKYEEAGRMYERSLAVLEKVLGPDHPGVAGSLNNRAGVLKAQGKYAEAIDGLERALSIRVKQLGRNHPNTVNTRNSLELMRMSKV